MNLAHLNVDALIKKIQKQVRHSEKSKVTVPSRLEEQNAESEIFDEMKKLPFTE